VSETEKACNSTGEFMPVGMIKLYNADKGFGFIAWEQDNDIFFHINTCGMDNPVYF